MITIKNLKYIKENKTILDIKESSINLDKDIGIFGKNGAGKTSLIKCILGVDSYQGSIVLSVERKNIQVLMQNNAYPSYAKVKDIMKLVLNTNDLSKTNELVEYFEFGSCINKHIGVLSGGELQKLNLILLFSIKHELLIVDEITTGLDYDTRKKLITYLKEYKLKNNTKIILISHYLDELEELVGEVVHLDKGAIIGIYSIDEFLNLKL